MKAKEIEDLFTPFRACFDMNSLMKMATFGRGIHSLNYAEKI